MALDLIDTSYTGIDVANIIPSFFEWLLGGALGMDNGSLFGIGFLLVITMISLLIFKPYGLDKAMMTSSIINLVIGFMFFKIGWINSFLFSLCLIYLAVALYYLFKATSETEA